MPLAGLRLALPPAAWVDVEAAADGVHRAESAIAQGDFHRAWGPSQVAMFISGRVFLPGEESAWIDDARRRLGELHLRALEAYAQAGLGIGGTELAAAVRAGRELTRREPYRETGHRLLMNALAREGNTAEALLRLRPTPHTPAATTSAPHRARRLGAAQAATSLRPREESCCRRVRRPSRSAARRNIVRAQWPDVAKTVSSSYFASGRSELSR